MQLQHSCFSQEEIRIRKMIFRLGQTPCGALRVSVRLFSSTESHPSTQTGQVHQGVEIVESALERTTEWQSNVVCADWTPWMCAVVLLALWHHRRGWTEKLPAWNHSVAFSFISAGQPNRGAAFVQRRIWKRKTAAFCLLGHSQWSSPAASIKHDQRHHAWRRLVLIPLNYG